VCRLVLAVKIPGLLQSRSVRLVPSTLGSWGWAAGRVRQPGFSAEAPERTGVQRSGVRLGREVSVRPGVAAAWSVCPPSDDPAERSGFSGEACRVF